MDDVCGYYHYIVICGLLLVYFGFVHWLISGASGGDKLINLGLLLLVFGILIIFLFLIYMFFKIRKEKKEKELSEITVIEPIKCDWCEGPIKKGEKIYNLKCTHKLCPYCIYRRRPHITMPYATCMVCAEKIKYVVELPN